MKRFIILPLLFCSALFLHCSDQAIGDRTDSDPDSCPSDFDDSPAATQSPTVISALSKVTDALTQQQEIINCLQEQMSAQQKQVKRLQAKVSQLNDRDKQNQKFLDIIFRAVQPKVLASPKSGRTSITSRARERSSALFKVLQIQPFIKDGKKTGAYVSGVLKTIMHEIINTKHRIAKLEKLNPQSSTGQELPPATK